MTQQTGLVQRLIAFLRKPDALVYDEHRTNPYDDFEPQDSYERETLPEAAITLLHRPPVVNGSDQTPSYASRLDAVVMRAVEQFSAQMGFVIRYDEEGQMHYCTGRDLQGRYISHTEADPDRRAMFLALDSGESQLFVHTLEDNTPVAILCGPLWVEDQVIGVLYLDNPARSHLHRGIFDLFCEQVARMLSESMV